ncbi:DsbA family protein [Aneurinibacillus sp. Ricciae_BoGa-3]|uniref:DsbA family protein n=1 Tax=Aneurinibacillus sp. Ricciae_BoGa-3 TaxID=3022697 RepID=UPI00234057FD|nr:DsbA family protein [Aneurinibacillus sp. Ricciae_BoGa-3]WCK53935.1 DsbA family protein [Aneurinibacillus sp. Ricciae_BoGa-3]
MITKQNVLLAIVTLLVLGVCALSVFYMYSFTNQKTTVHHFIYEDQPYLGKENAPVQIVEFGDFRCPDCATWERSYFPQLKREFIDTGKVKFTFMNFPILGPDSYTAALAGRAIYHQNPKAFWLFYSTVYNQGSKAEKWTTPKNLTGINYNQLQKDIMNQTYRREVDRDKAQGQAASVPGTPAFFINGKLVTSINYTDFKTLIERN